MADKLSYCRATQTALRSIQWKPGFKNTVVLSGNMELWIEVSSTCKDIFFSIARTFKDSSRNVARVFVSVSEDEEGEVQRYARYHLDSTMTGSEVSGYAGFQGLKKEILFNHDMNRAIYTILGRHEEFQDRLISLRQKVAA